MVGCECNGNGQRVKIVLSAGLVALALFAAVCIVVGERIAPRIEATFGIKQGPEFTPGGVSYDTLKNAPLNQLPVNEDASREVKKGDAECVTCVAMQQAGRPPATPSPAPPVSGTFVSVPVTKRYSIALFVGVDPQSQMLLDWWNRDAKLQELKKDCNFQAYTKDNQLYKERYAGVIPSDQFPAVLFTDPDGGHVYVAGRLYLPKTPSSLFSDLRAAYETQLKVREQQEHQRELDAAAESGPPCPDGNCRPVDREPFLNPDRPPLFPSLRPDRDNPSIESIFYWLFNPGEAVLAMCCVGLFAVLVLVVLIKVIKS